MDKTPKLGDTLVAIGAITPEQLDEALEEQKNTGHRLGEILLKKEFTSEGKIIDALSSQLGLQVFSLSRYRPMPEALRMIPESVARRLHAIPLSLEDDNTLLVAMSDPMDILAQDEIRMLTGMDIKVGIVAPSEVERNLERLYTIQDSMDDASLEFVDGVTAEMDLSQAMGEANPDDAPVIQLVNNVIEQAVREGASDVHLEPFEKNTRVRYRIDGQLFNAFDFPKHLHPAVSSRMKIMSGMDISEKRRPQDGRILIKVLGRRVDLRVSSLPTIYGEKMVIRILDQGNAKVGLSKLGLDSDDKVLVDKVIAAPYGIVLVTGPTGSGKSTTLYSILEQINRPEVNVVTVEDPVEYTMHGIGQVQVNERAGLTFNASLRSILRQDPDKIMVGEIRDGETAQLAIRAALTGHLVLSTLHTNDAPSAAIRLVDMGIQPFLVASSLLTVIAQRLVRNLCSSCKIEYTLPDPLCSTLNVPSGSTAFKPEGCNECRGTGYRGRSAIFEILEVTDPIRELIVNGASSAVVR
ncbi:MAG: ATPase, T2SS/T4P/T4SS family, partial [Synergistaceae bacterium]|nr:ATPase, T2SS/T4P/T4SS family [Synergistaceae bacterium]